MFSVLVSGGILMIPICLCAIVATYIIFERFVFFSSMKKRDSVLFSRIDSLIMKRDFDQSIAFCEEVNTPTSVLLQKVLKYRNYPDDDIHEAVEMESTRQITYVEKHLSSLNTIASISTLLGLLGTVIGNIRAFGVLGTSGSMGNPALLANSISEALVTTAAGLVVSIPSTIFYNYFVSQVNTTITLMETTVTELTIRLSGRDKLR